MPADTGNVTNQANAIERNVRIDTADESWISDTATTAPTCVVEEKSVENSRKYLYESTHDGVGVWRNG